MAKVTDRRFDCRSIGSGLQTMREFMPIAFLGVLGLIERIAALGGGWPRSEEVLPQSKAQAIRAGRAASVTTTTFRFC